MDQKVIPVIVSIVHYGDVAATILCVQSVCDSTASPCCVIVSSNGTTSENNAICEWADANLKLVVDISLESLLDVGHVLECSLESNSTTKASFILIRNGKNVGFAAGHNSVIKFVLRLGGEAVWLLNNDASVQADALFALWKCCEETKGNAIIGSTVVEASDPTVIQCAGGMNFNPYTTSVRPALAGKSFEKTMQYQHDKFDYIYGAAMFVPTKILKDIGLLNEDFFLYYEEIDFCRRALKAGYSLCWCKDAVLQHRGSIDQSDTVSRVYHDVRSCTLFVHKHYARSWLVMALVHAIGRSVAQLMRRRFADALAAGRGFWQGYQEALNTESTANVKRSL